MRREALEKLWDAWERIKTINPAKDKRASVKILLDKASPEERFRQILETDANQLTKIGNDFLIRHTETDKPPIQSHKHVDYLFHRLFAMIRLLLETLEGV
ncbi:MAG: hypothetical protein Fur0021_19670 [Candidatus Promineifilaceae bacterium]